MPPSETIRAWCRRGVSLGADGLFILRRGGAGAGATMDYFNADGLPADLCLNGTRCAAQLAFHLGWAEGKVRVSTGAGVFSARRLDAGRIAIDPRSRRGAAGLRLEIGGTEPASASSSASPISCFPGRGAGGAPVASWARDPSPSRLRPAGTNVNFVRFPAASGWRSGPTSGGSRTRPSPAAPACWRARPWGSRRAGPGCRCGWRRKGGSSWRSTAISSSGALVARRRRAGGRGGGDAPRSPGEPAPRLRAAAGAPLAGS